MIATPIAPPANWFTRKVVAVRWDLKAEAENTQTMPTAMRVRAKNSSRRSMGRRTSGAKVTRGVWEPRKVPG